jgi:hypothetical protein
LRARERPVTVLMMLLIRLDLRPLRGLLIWLRRLRRLLTVFLLLLLRLLARFIG